MAECIIIINGGGGVSSDELTATKDKVLNGYTFVGSDTNDEAGTGTFCSDATLISPSKLIKGQIAYGKNGERIVGTLEVTSAISFSAAALSATSIRISWTNPSKAAWEGIFIQMSTSSNPGVSGGTRVYTGIGNNSTPGGKNYVDITGLDPGTTYYFTCTSYATGLGNGSSYNVSAKTNGFMIYNRGVKAAGFSINTEYATDKGTYIRHNSTMKDVFYMPTINYANYEYIKFVISVPSYESDTCRYIHFWLKKIGGYGTQVNSENTDKCTLVNTEFEKSFWLENTTLNGDYSATLVIKNAADDTTEGDQIFYTHKIWLE